MAIEIKIDIKEPHKDCFVLRDEECYYIRTGLPMLMKLIINDDHIYSYRNWLVWCDKDNEENVVKLYSPGMKNIKTLFTLRNKPSSRHVLFIFAFICTHALNQDLHGVLLASMYGKELL